MAKKKSVLVTGATGSIGSVLARRLVQAGQSVRVLVRSPQKAATLFGKTNVEIFPGDLSNPISLRGCAEGCSLVYHCAAVLSTSDWAAARATNITGTQAVVDESVRAGVERLVYTSTIGVYGMTKEATISEETPWADYHLPYFETKQEAERIVQKAMGSIPTVIARLGDVFGPGQFTWTIDLARKASRGLLAALPAAESGYLNPVYIDNLVDALLLMGTHPAAPGQIFNVVDGTPILSSEFFSWFFRMAGRKTLVLPNFVMKAAAGVLSGFDALLGRPTTNLPGAVNYLLRKGKIYPTKIHSVLGWTPAIKQGEAFNRTEQWLKEEGYPGVSRN